MNKWKPARLGDRYRFEYAKDPLRNANLTVTEVDGIKANDAVTFEDGSYCYQKNLRKPPKGLKITALEKEVSTNETCYDI